MAVSFQKVAEMKFKWLSYQKIHESGQIKIQFCSNKPYSDLGENVIFFLY